MKKHHLLAFILSISVLLTIQLRAEPDWNATLQSELASASRFRVRSGGTCHRDMGHESTLLDLREVPEVKKLLEHIRIDSEKSGFHCMCCGNPTLEFYAGDKLIAAFGFHHGRSLRWDDGKWEGDALLTRESATYLVQWLSDHGVTGPKNEIEEAKKQALKWKADQARWAAAKPTSLKQFEDNGDGMLEPVEMKQMQSALTAEFPDRDTQILALLTWFGSGSGPWTGYPAYEAAPEKLLQEYPITDIITVIQTKQLSTAQIEGAARLLGDGTFLRRRPADLHQIPADIKQRLLEHCLKSDDEDKKGRATRSFSLAKNPAE